MKLRSTLLCRFILLCGYPSRVVVEIMLAEFKLVSCVINHVITLQTEGVHIGTPMCALPWDTPVLMCAGFGVLQNIFWVNCMAHIGSKVCQGHTHVCHLCTWTPMCATHIGCHSTHGASYPWPLFYIQTPLAVK
jgi:hypothetical protein